MGKRFIINEDERSVILNQHKELQKKIHSKIFLEQGTPTTQPQQQTTTQPQQQTTEQPKQSGGLKKFVPPIFPQEITTPKQGEPETF